MNAPAKIAPDRYATAIARAKAMHEASGNLLAALTRSGGKYSTNALMADLAFWEAAYAFGQDDSIPAIIDTRRGEIGVDEEDDPRRFFDASARHPDHPGGW